MCDILKMHVIEPKHDLINDWSGIIFSKILNFGKPFEKFSTFHDFWHHIIVLIVFN